MQHDTNELGQPVGKVVSGWKPPPVPARDPIEGRYCSVVPLDNEVHAEPLHAANALDATGAMWTYMSYGPFPSLASYAEWMAGVCRGSDPMFHAIVDHATGQPVGVASYLRIDVRSGAIEVGHVAYSPLLQRTRAATEAMVLMMGRAFGLGYRRYEWKCHSLNAASHAAAQRLGFSYEGVFRQATINKGRNRDTAWYAAIDSEWPALNDAYTRWLDPANFDDQGRQRLRLSELTRPIMQRNRASA